MPSLEHLLQELDQLGIKPDKVRVLGQVYDDILAKAEESSKNEED